MNKNNDPKSTISSGKKLLNTSKLNISALSFPQGDPSAYSNYQKKLKYHSEPFKYKQIHGGYNNATYGHDKLSMHDIIVDYKDIPDKISRGIPIDDLGQYGKTNEDIHNYMNNNRNEYIENEKSRVQYQWGRNGKIYDPGNLTEESLVRDDIRPYYEDDYIGMKMPIIMSYHPMNLDSDVVNYVPFLNADLENIGEAINTKITPIKDNGGAFTFEPNYKEYDIKDPEILTLMGLKNDETLIPIDNSSPGIFTMNEDVDLLNNYGTSGNDVDFGLKMRDIDLPNICVSKIGVNSNPDGDYVPTEYILNDQYKDASTFSVGTDKNSDYEQKLQYISSDLIDVYNNSIIAQNDETNESRINTGMYDMETNDPITQPIGTKFESDKTCNYHEGKMQSEGYNSKIKACNDYGDNMTKYNTNYIKNFYTE